MMRLDGDLTIGWRSQSGAAAILGLDAHHRLDGAAWEWLPPEGRAAFQRQTETLLTGTTSRAVRHAIRRPDGALVEVVTTAWRARTPTSSQSPSRPRSSQPDAPSLAQPLTGETGCMPDAGRLVGGRGEHVLTVERDGEQRMVATDELR